MPTDLKNHPLPPNATSYLPEDMSNVSFLRVLSIFASHPGNRDWMNSLGTLQDTIDLWYMITKQYGLTDVQSLIQELQSGKHDPYLWNKFVTSVVVNYPEKVFSREFNELTMRQKNAFYWPTVKRVPTLVK